MNCYTVRRWGQIEPHITVSPDRKIMVGEEGRGRELVLVPVPDSVPMERLPGSSGFLAISRIPGPAGALILLRDQSGFRGSWSLGGPFVETGCREGERIDSPDPCPRCGRRERHESVLAEPIPAGVQILAEGRCAQGTAGRMGGGPEYLLYAPPGTVLSVDRTGRTYDCPSRYHIVVAEDGTVSAADVMMERRSAEAESAFVALLKTPAGK